ncbi:aminotransferase class V-fold PLP-dependent enzyme [Candidatus Saccharibacteria bacterium]|nr:aminotransferase class V-fold PLP-dependent enzyme [Candidatus Saccharibacteria bacterium]
MNDFDYLTPDHVYLDSACQSLRPRLVLDALKNYYEQHNSCGERVKYAWGVETDEKVEATRRKVLKYLKLSSHEYFVSFTLNTTYGLNLILSQLDAAKLGIKRVITSDIEHNSPFLSTMTFAETHNIPRLILPRNRDGSLPLDSSEVDRPDLVETPTFNRDVFDHAVVVVNAASNFDGRKLINIRELAKLVHKNQGLLIIDAAQAMAHSADILHKVDVDAICFSAHKMYAPSLGGMIVKRNLIPYIKSTFVGGGMVDDVFKDKFLLSSENKDHAHTKFESGLQAWGEIIALGAALDWLENLPKEAHARLEENSRRLYEALDKHPKVHLLNAEVAAALEGSKKSSGLFGEKIAPSQPNPTMSFYIDGLDSHLLGAALGEEGIMARTGYFCVHDYLDHVRHYPPLIRFSLGYHNTPEDINKVIAMLSKI